MNPQSKDAKSEPSVWSTIGLSAAALLGAGAVGAALYYGSKIYPDKIYIIDLENIHSHLKDLSRENTVYLGFIASTHHDLKRYSDWTRCTTSNFGDFVNTFSKSSQKLLYVVDNPNPKPRSQVVDKKITDLVPEFIKYINQCCSPTSTVYLVAEDDFMDKVGSNLKEGLKKNEMNYVTVERIRDKKSSQL